MENLLFEISVKELRELRDTSSLVAGRQYAITDYVCTSSSENVKSESHRFDIIVIADSTSSLNENCRARHHSKDRYFSLSKIESWELKYSIDNDKTRFAWASENGNGVIYWLKDEFGNECSYDFKNVLFKKKVNNVEGYFYTFSFVDTKHGSKVYDSSVNQVDFHFRHPLFNIAGNVIESFRIDDSEKVSFKLNSICFIAEYHEDNGLAYSALCLSNHFERNCCDMVFGDMCSNNKFGFGCYKNIFKDNCNGNVFKAECYANIFGNYCSENEFGNSTVGIFAGDNFLWNSFKNFCIDIAFGTSCKSNEFGNSCSNCTFGNMLSGNTFKTYTSNLKLGDKVESKSF